MTQVTAKNIVAGADGHAANFSLAEKLLSEVGDGKLHEQRKAALNHFCTLGYPTTKMEDWRFTNIAPIAGTHFDLAELPHPLPSPERVAGQVFGAMAGCRLVSVNGHHVPSLSGLRGLPKGVIATSLAEVIAAGDPRIGSYLGRLLSLDKQAFEALNTAFLYDGLFVFVPRGVVVREPIHLVFLSAPGDVPAVSHPRALIVTEENTQATFVETYASTGDGVCFTNAVTELFAGENAVIDYYRLQHESSRAYHVDSFCTSQGRSSNVTATSISVGASISRSNIRVGLGGEGATSELFGLYMASGTQIVDNHTALDHAKPHCDSREFYKGILDDHAQAVFHGRIIVRPDAQKTDAKQTNKNLVLSPDATINTKPQLEIYADDVKCTHGATIGQLDEEPLFYLRSRGIAADAARNILIHAFAGDIVNRVKIAQVRGELEKLISTRLPQQDQERRP